ncbi:MAG: methylmalonyl-CoA mutase family protein [Thermodesulfobacteriota bacterium]|nr:methylmalonyl-CoA mutase family protein [Thermodesulfobacteriota bacterium]
MRDISPSQAPGLARAGRYSGYGTAEDYRDYQKHMQALGAKAGPNIAFDFPTQCGYDSDSPIAAGEVGKVGVAVDTLRNMEVIYEAFTGEMEIDRIASNFTILARNVRCPEGSLRQSPADEHIILYYSTQRGDLIGH